MTDKPFNYLARPLRPTRPCAAFVRERPSEYGCSMSRVLLFVFLLLGVIGVSGAAAGSSGVPVTDINKAGAIRIRVPGDWLASGAGSVWLSDPPAKVIRRLNARTGKTVATIRVRQLPCEAPDVGFGALWTATCETPGLARIDSGSHRSGIFVLRFRQAWTVRAASAQGLVESGSLSTVDSVSPAVWFGWPQRRCASSQRRVREFSAAVRVGQGAIWVTNPANGVVQKIDPRTNRVVATTKVGRGPRFLLSEGRRRTLNQQDGSVTHLDPTSAKAVAQMKAGIVGDGGDITAGGGWIWARGTERLLTRIDPRNNRVVEGTAPVREWRRGGRLRGGLGLRRHPHRLAASPTAAIACALALLASTNMRGRRFATVMEREGAVQAGNVHPPRRCKGYRMQIA